MIKYPGRTLILLLLISTLCTCIDPFAPRLNGFKSLLVVDALLTNENRSYSVRLSMTNETQNSDFSMVSGASVTISDEAGGYSELAETTPGIYRTDSLQFRGETGNTYTLRITTPEGKDYESDPCFMPPVNQIDSVYFIKDHEILNNGGETHDGIRIFVDTRGSADNKYFRWIYDECWKFNVPNPKKYNYINEHEIVEVDHINKTCWHTHTSDETIIQSAGSDRSDLIQKEPVLFVATDMSNRLLVQYSVNIKQLSLSEAEFEFWDHMKQINESGGDIFEKQPFAIISNIHNLTDPDDQVLGYFQVSSVEQKRIFVTASDVRRLNIPAFQYDCTRIEIGPDDYPRPEPPGKPATFDKIYGWFTDSGVIFVEPVYDKQHNLFKLVFTQPLCMDCTLSGTLTKPDFWIDLE